MRGKSSSPSSPPTLQLLSGVLLVVIVSYPQVEPATTAGAMYGETKPTASSLHASARALWRWKSNITIPSSSTSLLSSWQLDAATNNSSRAPCSWWGVRCSYVRERIAVTAIELPERGIIGSLNELDFEAFPSLTHLNLSHNRLHGRIPSRLPAQLVSLDLHDNVLTGSIPGSIGDLTRLQALDVSVNGLQSPLPLQMANLKSLLSLNLSVNNLGSGAGALTKADLLSTVALELNLSATLTSLDIGYNGMTGEISGRALSVLVKLKYLSASGNDFSGGIPAAIEQLRNLTYLSLYNCSLSGPIPEELASLDRLATLDLAQNHFSGPLPPYLGKLPNLNFLKLSYNNLTSEIPPQLGNLSALQFIKLKRNQLTGAVPVELCRLMSLRIIEFSNNQLSGDIPACLGTMSSLRVIDLRNNHFTGVIPAEICASLPLLEVVNLSNNSITGTIPNLTRCGNLVSLDLGENHLRGPIPEWLLDHHGSTMSRLRILRLTSNSFRGTIPQDLCRLPSLRYLDISHNQLTGPIPPELGTLQAMKNLSAPVQELRSVAKEQYIDGVNVVWKGKFKYIREVLTFLSGIDLSGNKLSGRIPSELMDLAGMILLNLSWNELSGPIPPEIGGLVKMESLDFSNNHLSGSIPETLSQLKSLSTLNLSNNELYGRIPTGIQLQSQPPSSYDGNIGLCGHPLREVCDDGRSHGVWEELINSKFDMKCFWWGSIPGFIVGIALVICGNLMLRKKNCETEVQYTNYLDSSSVNPERPFLYKLEVVGSECRH